MPNFGGATGANTTVIDAAYNNVSVTRCTDAKTDSALPGVSYYAGLGGSSAKEIWNTDDTLLLFSNVQGGNFVMRFDPQAKTCSPVKGADGALFELNPGVFSKTDPTIFYDFLWPNAFQVSPVTITAKGVPKVGQPIVDFKPALYQTDVPDWPRTNTAVGLGTVIKPAHKNPNRWLFQATNSGTTDAVEPNWSTTTIPSNQSTSTPHRIRDGSVTWENVGASSSATPYVDPGGVEAGERYVAESVSFDGAQDTGVWALVYDRQKNVIHQYNTWSGIETDFTLSNGTWTPRVVGKATQDRLIWHENGLGFDGLHFVLSIALCGNCAQSSPIEVWQVGKAVTTQMWPYPTGHMSGGYSHIINQDGDISYFAVRPLDALGQYAVLWEPNPCTDTSEVKPPYPTPPCYPQFDSHLSWNYNRGADQEPVIGTTTLNDATTRHTSPWQRELIGIPTCGTAPRSPCPQGYAQGVIWRFGRTFNFRVTGGFYDSIASGAVSQTGRYYALTSVGNGTMGRSANGQPRSDVLVYQLQ